MTCETCTGEINRWLDSRPSTVIPRLGLVGGTAAYDATAAGIVGNQRARYEEWRTLVRDQISLIRRYCAAGHSAGASDKSLPISVHAPVEWLV